MLTTHDIQSSLKKGEMFMKNTSYYPAPTTTMSLYMKNINEIPLLTREEEYELAIRWYER